jgi:GalNAc-alpha-(1->4)-GalNAc-alpha-(1->3)-diNAcBac-PP-undecaprenol alpha-1,4-N-acetyl-D-galactosaminyltransferase
MNILFVIDNLSTGGAQRQMVNLALGLHARGHQIEFFCYTPGDLLAHPLKQTGIPITWQFKKSRFSVDVIFSLKANIQSQKYDVILSYLSTPNFYTLIASHLVKHRPKIVISERWYDPVEGISKLEWSIRQFYRWTDHLVFNSRHQKQTFYKKYPWCRKKISTIYNGYDLKAFYPPASEPENENLKILVIASVSPWKNGLCLIRALNLLRAEGIKPEVSWIGQRVREGNRLEYLQQMGEEIKTNVLESQWSWYDQRTDILAQMHSHDVLVHPSYGEGLPNVVCEAMACGRPVIVSNALDHSILVRDKDNGYLFDHNDPVDLSNKIKLFSKLSIADRHEMGLRGRAYAETNLSLERFVDDYEKLFYSLVESFPKSNKDHHG